MLTQGEQEEKSWIKPFNVVFKSSFERVMKEFFKVAGLEEVLSLRRGFKPLRTETVATIESLDRVLAEEVISDVDIPGFSRSTMDGYAIQSASTFGASESHPAFLTIVGAVAMGQAPQFAVNQGQAAKIATGGMLPDGADCVVMIEQTDLMADNAIEVFKSMTPGQNVIERGEDLKKDKSILGSGRRIRPQEQGLLAASGKQSVRVYKKPVVGIISTGDEVVAIDRQPQMGQIRDINSFTLAAMVTQVGGIPVTYGIAKDNADDLKGKCIAALADSDMVLISGGSSVGLRDLTIDVLESLPKARVLIHGISISPGKPTILARSDEKIIWGLPGHAVSAMVVFLAVVKPFLSYLEGIPINTAVVPLPTARLTRNIPSVQGRVDYIRVRLVERDGELWAEPVLGKSGLIRTMVEAQGLVAIDLNQEGLEQGTPVRVLPI